MRYKKDLVSVVITYFRKKKYIKKTLRSISNQNYKYYEIVLVYDDPSKADLPYIKKLLEAFELKKIIINNKNLGVAKSRNLAKNYCRGEFIAFLDSDDIWKKNKLFFQINYMKKKSSLISFTSYDVINEKDRLLEKRIVVKEPNYENISRSCFIGLSTVIAHRKIFSLLNFPNLKTQEDLGLWLKLLRKGVRFSHIKKTLSYWRQTRNSLSSNIYNKLFDAFILYYVYEKKNLLNSIFRVLMLSYNKIFKKFY